MRTSKTKILLLPKTVNSVLAKDADQMAKSNLDTIVWQNTIKRYLDQAAQSLAIDATELAQWVKEVSSTSPLNLIHCLKLISEFKLDPFTHEITLISDPQTLGESFIHITIDGWIKILNGQAQFDGFELEESEERTGQVPLWLLCKIYRKDRKVPISVKEYFSELKTEHEVWTCMPYRMLRYRTIAACVRIAFGVSISESSHGLAPKTETAKRNNALGKSTAQNTIKDLPDFINRTHLLKETINQIQNQNAIPR